MSINSIQPKVQIRVLVPENNSAKMDQKHTAFQEWVCDYFGGFSVNPGELIRGAWLNPETKLIECDFMMVYYIWLDSGNEERITRNCIDIAQQVKYVFGEKAVGIIRDNTITPTIYS